MSKLPSKPASRHVNQDHRPAVVRIAAYATGTFFTAVPSLMVAAGQWQIDDGTLRLAIVAVTAIAALAQLVAAVSILRR
ncbi:hypothetical protein [Actinoplanes xinjiangensis]|uniref:Uncharacterized protein n=1 Tax=Actinoplanes xinjiangensis TaxID=512350 RepID=A0A316F4V6_9ACTN|nr:hypothetical protein [Actinoplanes xinjiangensis]PWK40854.1 hypothetical protein BC793_11884 [Actinoplanes xinjiangensis]GIF43367.1 hypothetical protein Axi01nite_76780 [Actinoplanes xinjiangensis]